MPLHDDTFKVMVSSSLADLPDHREAVFNAIQRCQLVLVAKEFDAPDGTTPLEASRKRVDEAHIYVGIIGLAYGEIPTDTEHNPNELSFTELEYRYAVKQGKTILPFIMAENHLVSGTAANIGKFVEMDAAKREKLKALQAEMTQKHQAGKFDSADNLATIALQALSHLKARLLAESRNEPPPSDSPLPAPPELYADPHYLLSGNFVGREIELNWLDAWAKSPDPMCIVEAIGGMGKSALAWEWVNNCAREVLKPAGIVWWSFYEEGQTMREFIRYTLAYIIRRDPMVIGKMPLIDQVKLLRAALKNQSYLLVLDGFERLLMHYRPHNETEMGDDGLIRKKQIRDCAEDFDGDFIRSLLLSDMPTKILIATRLFPGNLEDPSTGKRLDGIYHIDLKGLSSLAARTLLINIGVRWHDNDRLDAFLEQFWQHSQAVKVIGGIVAKDNNARGDFDIWYEANREKFRMSKLNLKERRNHILAFALNKLQYRPLLIRIAALGMAVSYDIVKMLNPYVSAGSESMLDDALSDLVGRGLLESNNKSLYDMHPLIREHIRDTLDDSETEAILGVINTLPASSIVYQMLISVGKPGLAVDFYIRHIMASDLDNQNRLELLKALFPQNHPVGVPVALSADHRVFILNQTIHALLELEQYHTARRLIELVLGFSVNEKDLVETTNQLLNYGNLLYRINRPAMALQAYKLRRDLSETDTDEDRRMWSHTYLLELMDVFSRTGQWKQADETYLQYISYFHAFLPDQKCKMELDYALCMFMQERITDAWSHLNEAIVVTQTGNFSLPLLHWFTGEFALKEREADSAAAQFEEAIRISRKTDKAETAKYLGCLARARVMQKDMNFARSLIEEALAETYQWDKHHLYNSAAEVYEALGETEKAKEWARKAYEESWADGPTYVWSWSLERAKATLDKLQVTVDISSSNQALFEKIPYEDEILEWIEELTIQRYRFTSSDEIDIFSPG